MPLRPPESETADFPIAGKVVYLEEFAGILRKLGPLVIEVTQPNDTVSVVEDLEDLNGRNIDEVRLVARVDDPERLIGYYDMASVEMGSPYLSRAVIDKGQAEAIAQVRHFLNTLEDFEVPWLWRMRHPRSLAGAQRQIEIITERRAESREAARASAHDVRMVLLGAGAGSLLTIIGDVLIRVLD